MSQKSNITLHKNNSENDSSTIFKQFLYCKSWCEIMDLRHMLQDKIDRYFVALKLSPRGNLINFIRGSCNREIWD